MIENNEDSTLLDPSELYDQYLSFYDLMHYPDFEQAWHEQDTNKIESILDSLGADLTHGYEMTICTHRGRIDQKVHESCPRWGFKEKNTKEHIKYMTVEDVIRSTADKSLRQEMLEMSKRSGLGNFVKNEE